MAFPLAGIGRRVTTTTSTVEKRYVHWELCRRIDGMASYIVTVASHGMHDRYFKAGLLLVLGRLQTAFSILRSATLTVADR